MSVKTSVCCQADGSRFKPVDIWEAGWKNMQPNREAADFSRKPGTDDITAIIFTSITCQTSKHFWFIPTLKTCIKSNAESEQAVTVISWPVRDRQKKVDGLRDKLNFVLVWFQPTGLRAWIRGRTWSFSSCASSSGFGWRAGCSSCGWFPGRRSARRLWSSLMTLKSCSGVAVVHGKHKKRILFMEMQFSGYYQCNTSFFSPWAAYYYVNWMTSFGL